MTTAQWLGLTLQVSIMLTVLSLGLTASWDEALYLLRRPKLLIPAILSMNVVMPILAALAAAAFSLPDAVEVAFVALAVSPVPPLLHKKQLSAGCRHEYVVGLLVAMALLAIITVPLTVLILDHLFDRAGVIGPAKVAKIMLTSVIAPLVVGLLIRHFFPKSEKACQVILQIAGVMMIVAGLALLYGLWPVIRTYLGNGVAVMLLALAVVGLCVGHFFGGPLASDRTALAISTSSRHPAVALAIATSGAAHELKQELAIILMYVLLAALASIPYQKWRAKVTAGSAAARGAA